MSILDPGTLPRPPISSNSSQKRRVVNFLPIFLAFSGISVAVLGSFAVVKTKPELLGLSRISSSQTSKDEVSQLTKEVGKIIELPEETPVLATVTDLEKVKNQDFFAKAKLGDKVLIYTNAKKAILYRPDEKKVIEVGRVNQEQGQVAGQDITVATPSPTTTVPQVIETGIVTPTTTPTTSNQ